MQVSPKERKYKGACATTPRPSCHDSLLSHTMRQCTQ